MKWNVDYSGIFFIYTLLSAFISRNNWRQQHLITCPHRLFRLSRSPRTSPFVRHFLRLTLLETNICSSFEPCLLPRRSQYSWVPMPSCLQDLFNLRQQIPPQITIRFGQSETHIYRDSPVPCYSGHSLCPGGKDRPLSAPHLVSRQFQVKHKLSQCPKLLRTWNTSTPPMQRQSTNPVASPPPGFHQRVGFLPAPAWPQCTGSTNAMGWSGGRPPGLTLKFNRVSHFGCCSVAQWERGKPESHCHLSWRTYSKYRGHLTQPSIAAFSWEQLWGARAHDSDSEHWNFDSAPWQAMLTLGKYYPL